MSKVNFLGPEDAKILIIGEYLTINDLKRGKPLDGSAGAELSSMLHEAKILRSSCRVTLAFNELPPNGDSENFFLKNTPKETILKPLYHSHIEALWKEIERVQPNVIVPLGDLALWAVTSQMSSAKWRGSLMTAKPPIAFLPSREFKVLPTYSPAQILKVWSWRYIMVNDLKRVEKEAESPLLNLPSLTYIIRPSFSIAYEYLNEILSFINKNPDSPISCDIETIGRQISCVGYSTNQSEAICIPHMTKDTPNKSYWSLSDEFKILQIQRAILRRGAILGQNFIYDMQYLIRYFAVQPNLRFDTMVGWHVCYPGERKALDFISSMLCGKYVYWKDELKDYKALPEDEDEFWTYNCKDNLYTYENWSKISQLIPHLGLTDQYNFLMDCHRPLLRAMLRGIKINQSLKSEMSLELWDVMREYQLYFERILPGYKPSPKSKSAWYDSPSQLKKLLYEDLGLPKQWNRAGGKVTLTTDDEALEKLSHKEPLVKPLMKKLREYRSLGVFQNNFLASKLEADGYMRCSYKIAGPETFRLASSEDAFGYGTNFQNLPTGNEI